jgi:hypothetical protein
VLVFSAWRNRAGALWIIAAVAVGVVIWMLYLEGLPAHEDLIHFDRTRLVASADFVIRFLGLPWSHSAALLWPSRIVGVAILCCGTFLVVADAISKRVKPQVERIGLGMVQFAFLIAVAAAISRWDTAPDRDMPVRYGMIVLIAHAGLLLASVRWLAALLDGPHAGRIHAAIVACGLLLLVQQFLVGRAAIAETNRYADAWTRFAAGAWTPDMEHYVYPDAAQARIMLDLLKRKHIYGQ